MQIPLETRKTHEQLVINAVLYALDSFAHGRLKKSKYADKIA